MKASELRVKTAQDLKSLLQEKAGENLKSRLQVAGGHSTRHHIVRETRRDIARIKMVMNELEKE